VAAAPAKLKRASFRRFVQASLLRPSQKNWRYQSAVTFQVGSRSDHLDRVGSRHRPPECGGHIFSGCTVSRTEAAVAARCGACTQVRGCPTMGRRALFPHSRRVQLNLRPDACVASSCSIANRASWSLSRLPEVYMSRKGRSASAVPAPPWRAAAPASVSKSNVTLRSLTPGARAAGN